VKPGAASAGSESVLIFVERWWRDDLPRTGQQRGTVGRPAAAREALVS
jgi:hypothetical protein